MPLVYLRRARRTHDTLTWVFNDDPNGLNGLALVEEDSQGALASGTFEFPDYQSDSIILVEQNSQDALASGTFEFPDYHDNVLQFGPESPPPVTNPDDVDPGDNIVDVNLTTATYTADPSVQGFEFYDGSSPTYTLTDSYAVARITESASISIYTGPNYSNTYTINESLNYFAGVRDKFYGVTNSGQFKVWTYDAGWTSTNGPALTAITTTEEGETWLNASVIAMTVNRIYAANTDPNTYIRTIKVVSANTGSLLAEIDASAVPANERWSFGFSISVSPDESLIAIDAHPKTYVYEKTASGYVYLGNVDGVAPTMTSTSLFTRSDTGILEHTWNGTSFTTSTVISGSFTQLAAIPSGNAFVTFRDAQKDYVLYARASAGSAWTLVRTFTTPGPYGYTNSGSPIYISNDGARIVLSYSYEGNNFTVYKKN